MTTNVEFWKRVRDGEQLIGTVITQGLPAIAEIMSHAGYDFLWLDAEHGAFDPVQTLPLLQAARRPCLVRVPEADNVWIKKALDAGAAGIIAPQVGSGAQAEAVVRAAKYPPRGHRGIGLARAHAYGFDFDRYLASANEETIVVLQIESRAGVEAAAEICAVPGVDAIMVGPNDLAASLGHIGKLDHPEVRAAVEAVKACATAAGVALGWFSGTVAGARQAIEAGFTLVGVGSDVGLLRAAAVDTLRAVRDR